jgi:hypothetical protein
MSERTVATTRFCVVRSVLPMLLVVLFSLFFSYAFFSVKLIS